MEANTALKKTALHEAALKAGARMVPFAGWEMALQYEGLLEEHKAVRQSCGMFDISHMGVLRMRGRGVKDALQQLVPTDLFRIGTSEACYTVLLNESGGILDDLIIYDRGWNEEVQTHELLLIVNAACTTNDMAWISGELGTEDITIEDHKKDGCLIAVQGPDSATHL
jgi:aminomethyltransferase